MVALHTRAPVPAFVGLAGVAVRDVTPAPASGPATGARRTGTSPRAPTAR